MAGGKQKRANLYQLYSTNLAIHDPGMVGRFRCPICLQVFGPEHVQGNPPELAIAHIVPRSIGGRMLTLCCRKCDNKSGHSSDFHLKMEAAFSAWEAGQAKLPVLLLFDGGRAAATWKMEPERNQLELLPGQFSPDVPEKLLGVLRRKGEFTLRVKTASPLPLARALVRAGLLAMFRCFGYEYVLSTAAEEVRASLASEQLILAQAILRVRAKNFPSALAGVPGVLTQPADLRCFVVPFINPSNGQLRLVTLPGFGEQGRDWYSRIVDLAPALRGSLAVETITDDPRIWLTKPERKECAHNVWRYKACA